MKPLILLIDDEKPSMRYHKTAMERRGMEVHQCHDPDSAVAFIKQGARIRLIVLDIMMPPGQILEKIDTKEGLETGVYLIDKLRELCPDVPIIVLTNVVDTTLLHDLSERVQKVCQKTDLLPSAFADLVLRALIEPTKA